MKFIELTEEAEKALSQIVDTALKSGGLMVHSLVNILTSHMHNKEEDKPKNVPLVKENKEDGKQ